uniref:TOG array regulator of axonemal microtubules 1 n=1 Tax=Junco hyemalis TaxID=40217 RepID=A0A8C5J2Y4_JUNHY
PAHGPSQPTALPVPAAPPLSPCRAGPPRSRSCRTRTPPGDARPHSRPPRGSVPAVSRPRSAGPAPTCAGVPQARPGRAAAASFRRSATARPSLPAAPPRAPRQLTAAPPHTPTPAGPRALPQRAPRGGTPPFRFPAAAAPRGRGRAWERGGSAQHRADGTEPPGPAHNGPGTELSGPAHNGSDADPPGPALNGPGTDAPGPIHDGSDTEPPGPAEDGLGTEPPGHAHNGSGTEPPSPAEDEPGTEPLGPQEDAAASLGPELPLVPPELRARLLDRRDYRGRAQAVEQLRRAVEGCSPAALGAAPAAALLGLIALLDALLHDPNFAVARGALEVTRLLALRLGRRVPAVLAPLVCAAARALGDAQPAMRRDSARLLLRLMAAAGPRPVLRLLLQERLLRHRSARLREELLHTCIAALLAFPAAELDLPQLAAALAPALLDAKRRVRHAAMEAMAALASALGPGNAGALLRALDAVELRAGGAGAALAVRARLARNALPRLGQQGLVEYGVPLPCSGRCRGPCPPPGPDTEWLLMGSRSRSAHGHCGHPACRGALHGPACAQRGMSPRRVLSAGRGKNKLPWESEPAADGEGGSGVRMPVAKGVEQVWNSPGAFIDPLQPPKAQQGSAELLFSRSRTSRTALQPSVELGPEHPALAPQVSGKCGTLGYSRGRSGSVGSDLQFLGLGNCQQDKVCSSLSFSSKTQRSFCTQAEPTMSFQGPSASQGTFILPSFPLASPRTSPKHLSAPAALAGRRQEELRSLSSSWPLKSFQGLPKPGGQKQLLSQKPGDSTGGNGLNLEKPPLQLEKPPLQLRSALGRGQALRGARPVPPIPRLPSPRERPGSREGTELAAGLAELHLQPEQVDQEEMQNSLRSLRSSAAKKRAKLSSSMAELESPDSAVKLEFPGDCPSLGSSPGAVSTGESGIASLESLGSPVATLPPRRRVMSDTFPALGSKCHPAEASPARPREAEGAEQPPGTGMFLPTKVRSEKILIPHADLGQHQELGVQFWGNLRLVSFLQIKVTLSKSAQEKLRRRRKEDKEHNHKEQQEGKDLEGKEEFPWERIRLSMSEPEKLTAEKEPCPGRGRCREPPVTQSPEVLDPAELLPFPRPEPALAEALALLADHDWEKKIEGLNFVRCLSAYHAPILTAKLHETTLAVAQEVKNLRSGVSRAAVVCLGDLFTHLKKSMDQEVDNAVKVLLHKAGESNTFIREEVDKALKAMVNNVTPARALCSLINGGQSHLHSAVRRCTAQHVGDIVQRLGPERVLAAGRPVAERLLPAVARFVQDSSQQTRFPTHLLSQILGGHKLLQDFIQVRMTSCSNSWNSISLWHRDCTESQEAPRRAAPRSALESEEFLRDLVGSLNARDFRERIRGVRQLLLDTESSPALVLANIVRIFDAFKPRLHDSNSKVTQVALEAMHRMIPLLKDNLSPVINMLIPAIVDNNLNSKNPGIYAAATNVIQALCQHLDTSLLLQPFCTKAQFLSGKAKQDLTEKLAELVPELYPRKPCAVEQKVLPVLWHLLGSSAGGSSVPGPRTATAALAQALWAQMGPGLLARAAAQPPHIRKNLEELLETGT